MKRNLRNHVISLLISVMLFIVLACLLCFYPEFLINNDNHFLTVINTIVNPVLTMAMILITQLGSPAIISVLFIIFIILTSYKSRKQLYLYGAYYFGTSALGLLLKHLFMRSRPDHQLLLDTGFSFPSGHTLCILLFFLAFYHMMRAKETRSVVSKMSLIGFGVFTILVIFSRVYLRDHFPSDVMASLLLSVGAYSLLNIMEGAILPKPTAS